MRGSLHKALCAIALAGACLAAFAEEGVSSDKIVIGQTIGTGLRACHTERQFKDGV